MAANMFLYYVPGDRLKHVSPDLFVVHGVAKDKPRKKYSLWEEGARPELVVELTSGAAPPRQVITAACYNHHKGACVPRRGFQHFAAAGLYRATAQRRGMEAKARRGGLQH